MKYEPVANHAGHTRDKSVPGDEPIKKGLIVDTDNNAPTATDIALVRLTFDLVVPISGIAADMFYERLFYMAPSLRHMFPEDMRDQKRKLMMMLATAVNGLKNLDALAPVLMELGARHAGYGVKDYHYKAVGEALIWTLERGLADKFTPAVERAWVRVYLLVAATMQAGADQVKQMQAAE
ncbi:MAG TPA: globin family protein [Gemmatimonadales bacterium]|nr:globin family protein [Gemmatimonadales bacterium]